MAGKDETYDSLATKVFRITMVGAALAISAAVVWTLI
jgi:hypothetical protein